MLFNSPEFIFAFFPLTVAGFFLLARVSRQWAAAWLIVASLFFYAWWNPLNVLIIGPSVLVNYGFAVLIRRLASTPNRVGVGRLVLISGIVFNVLFLGYFKYLNFFKLALNDLAGTELVISAVILPLGISFITFQKIAFLIDVHANRVREFTFKEFCLFVLFFPQLIAGPIVHFRETMPQFLRHTGRFDKTAFATGLTLFCMGLFKKVVLADGIAEFVSPIYRQAAAGGTVTLLSAWAAAVGFTLQMYFDFSGYSDMAIGLARCFGIRLPINFDSPLKASSIIDFWLRWHMTLTRFLTAYIYNPLVLGLTRRRVAKNLPVLGRNVSVGAFLQLLAGPTLLTMLVSGLWHGAGYLFILWGLVHGVLLTINHAWRIAIRGVWTNRNSYARVMRPVGFVLTFVSVAFAIVLFRSATAAGAAELLAGMIGLNGVSLPRGLLGPLGLINKIPLVGVDEGGVFEFVKMYAWLAMLLGIALLLPNSLQIMARYEPALVSSQRPVGKEPFLARVLSWRPTIPWAVSMSVLAAAAILRLSGVSEFLYWQF